MRGKYSAIGQRTFFSSVRRVDFINRHGCQRSCRKNEKEELCAIDAGNTRRKQCNQHTAKGTAGEHKAGRGCGVPGEADGRVADDKRIDGCKAEGIERSENECRGGRFGSSRQKEKDGGKSKGAEADPLSAFTDEADQESGDDIHGMVQRKRRHTCANRAEPFLIKDAKEVRKSIACRAGKHQRQRTPKQRRVG